MATRESSDEYYQKYHASPRAKKERAMRNKARRNAEAAGKVHKGDGKEVDHIKALSNGGSNSEKNTRIIERRKNRAYKRNARNKPIGSA